MGRALKQLGLEQWFSAKWFFSSQRIFGSICRHFLLSQLEVEEGKVATGTW